MFLNVWLMVSEAGRVGTNTGWTCSNFWICQIQKRLILWWKRDFEPKSINISLVFKGFSKKVLLWLQRRAPTDHRTAATASLFFENVVKPMVLATFFVGAERRISTFLSPAFNPPEPHTPLRYLFGEICTPKRHQKHTKTHHKHTKHIPKTH